MTWAKLLLACAQITLYLLKYASERELISAGEQSALASLLKAEANAVEKATAAREKARASNALVPKSDGLSNDGFRRD
jgi:hypothetical protein